MTPENYEDGQPIAAGSIAKFLNYVRAQGSESTTVYESETNQCYLPLTGNVTFSAQVVTQLTGGATSQPSALATITVVDEDGPVVIPDPTPITVNRPERTILRVIVPEGKTVRVSVEEN